MKTTSLIFIPFLFIVFIGSWIFKGRLRKTTLLIANTLFALSFIEWNYFYLLFIIFITYGFGLALAKYKRKKVLGFSVSIVLVGLLFFKYSFAFPAFNSIIAPIGISFYTFKAISYLVDVYYEKCVCFKNPIDFYCYMSFFPTLSAGPIHRGQEFYNDINYPRIFDYKEAKGGVFLCALGIFQKIVFSDYLTIITSNIFNRNSVGITLFLGVLLYSFQIYLDFDSYSNIAIGAARCLGINVGPNFKTPYLAQNLKEFWRRWHISLSTWFRDYVYIPLGGNRKGELRKHCNLLIVFLLSGLWHGSTLNFLIWGAGHGLIQIIEEKIKNVIKIKNNPFLVLIKIIINFMIVSLLWIFFRSTNFQDAISLVLNCFNTTPLSLAWMGINSNQAVWLIVILFIVIVTDILRNKTDMIIWFNERNFILRWMFYILLLVIFIIFGIYGSGYNPQDFIYIQF